MNRERICDVAEVLLDYVETHKTFQTDRIMTVPAGNYTDPEQQRAEIERIFKRAPLMLAFSCEVPRPGDYKALEVVGLPIVIVRDDAGTVRAFLNVCAHRWSPVAAEGYGNCRRFICPFHGWTYSTNGELIGVTESAKFGDIDRSKHGLRQLPCEERHGMIFCRLTPGLPIDLDGYYGALLEEYAGLGLQDWTFLGSQAFDGANWKITMHNFFESYHFARLHSETVAKELVSNVSHYEGFGPNVRIGLAWRSIPKLRETPRIQWGSREGLEFGFIRFFFPSTTGFLAKGITTLLFTHTFPGPTPDKSRTVSLFACKNVPKNAADQEIIKDTIKNLPRIVQDEDLAIGIQIQKGLQSGAHEGLLYGRNERANQYFQEWLSWYLQDDTTAPKPVL